MRDLSWEYQIQRLDNIKDEFFTPKNLFGAVLTADIFINNIKNSIALIVNIMV